MIKMNNGAKPLKVFLQETDDTTIRQPHGVALCLALGNQLVVWNIFKYHAKGHPEPGYEAEHGAYFTLKNLDKASIHYRGIHKEAVREFNLRVASLSQRA